MVLLVINIAADVIGTVVMLWAAFRGSWITFAVSLPLSVAMQSRLLSGTWLARYTDHYRGREGDDR